MKGKGSVLIADDERAIVEASARLLKGRGYDCECVLSGEEALAALRARRHDALVTDIKMDGNRELELVRALPTVAPGLQAVIVTGHAEVQTAVAAHDLPVAAYLLKPVDVGAFVAAVDRAVAHYRLHRAASAARAHIAEWDEALVAFQQPAGAWTPSPLTTQDYMALALTSSARSLADLARLCEATRLVAMDCDYQRCPHVGQLRSAIESAVAGLEASKKLVRSRELAEVRRGLQAAIDRCDGGDAPDETPRNDRMAD